MIGQVILIDLNFVKVNILHYYLSDMDKLERSYAEKF